MSYAFSGYSADYDFSKYTPVDSTGASYDIFASAYRNVRFNVSATQQYQLTAADVANLPGLAFRFFGDTSLWRVLLDYNGLSDPLSDITMGMVIQIPTKADVIAYISQQTTSKKQSFTI